MPSNFGGIFSSNSLFGSSKSTAESFNFLQMFSVHFNCESGIHHATCDTSRKIHVKIKSKGNNTSITEDGRSHSALIMNLIKLKGTAKLTAQGLTGMSQGFQIFFFF